MTYRHTPRRDDQTAVCSACERRNVALKVVGLARVDLIDLHSERWCHGLDDAELSNATRVGRIPNDGRPRHTRCDLLEQLQPFPCQAVFGDHETSGVAA